MMVPRRGRTVLVITIAGVALFAGACSGAASKPKASATTTTYSTSTVAATTSIAPATTTAAPSTTTTSLKPSFTTVAYVAPVDTHGHQVTGLSISSTVAGTCQPGSDAIGSVSVYRCMAGNSIYDPCWSVVSTATAVRDAVLCMAAPWSKAVTKIVVPGLAASVTTGAPDLDFPWGVQLTSGQQCTALQGAHDQFNGQVVDYSCASSGAQPALQLLRGVDRTGALWTYHSVIHNGSTYTPGPAVTVRTAWFAGPR